MFNKDFVTCGMKGRLGNNMFMMANLLAKALKYNRQMVILESEVFDIESYRNNIYRNFSFYSGNVPPARSVNVRHHHYEDVKPYEGEPTVFRGFYQSEKNFKEYSEIIKWFFEPTEEFAQQMYAEFPELLTQNVTCINVRRGRDYLMKPTIHPVVTMSYINEAVKCIPNTDFYFILSDDLAWCKENIVLPNSKFIEYTTWKALWLMSLCKNFIISNSSFSWWAAYLSRHSDKIVIAPETWCGPEGPQDITDIHCEGWTVLSTYYKDGTIVPRIS